MRVGIAAAQWIDLYRASLETKDSRAASLGQERVTLRMS